MEATAHYQALFRKLEWMHGPLDGEIVAAIVGFNVGGPVSLAKIATKNVYATYELSLSPKQKPSTEGLRFELLSIGSFDEETCRELFTVLGNLSLTKQLGDGHTIDVRAAMKTTNLSQVKLRLFSESQINKGTFGVYQVVRHQSANDT
jgi:hypothetical protein